MKKWSVVLVFLVVMTSFNTTVFAEMQYEDDSDKTEVTAKVATYNIQAGSGVDGKYDIKRTASVIRDMEADVIGIQEVDVHWGDRSDFENTMKLLADELGMEYYFAPIYDLDPIEEGDARRQYGVGLLSKYPIMNAKNHEITRLSTQDPDPEPKPSPGFLEVQVDIDGAHVWFYVTHLDYRADPAIREMQVDEMLEIMGEHHYNILVGDFNAPPEADELTPLFNWFNDTWNTTHQGDGFTFPADDPIKRIDYVITSPRMKVDDAQVYSSLASDHLPVMANVTFVPGNHSLSAEGMRSLVDAFLEKNEINSELAAHRLDMHLQAVFHFEKGNKNHKVIKHLKNFKILLEAQRDEGLLTENAYSILYGDADYLIGKWKDN